MSAGQAPADAVPTAAAAWQDLLPEASGDAGQIFVDAGGDSLVAARLVGRIRRELSRRISVAELLGGMTVGDLSAALTDEWRIVENAEFDLLLGDPAAPNDGLVGTFP